MSFNKGYTLLELLVTVAIIGSVIAVGAGTGMGDLNTKKTAQNTYKELRSQLATLRNHAMSKNTTGRLVITQSGSTYTMTSTYSSAPTSTCSAAGTWTTIQTKEIDVHTNYNITGSAFTNSICFYRDGSSSGGSYVIAPVSGASGTTYTLDVTIATGYIDVTES
jgi:prepilin-type N-terminal cleavage/methylation domain-containing protein